MKYIVKYFEIDNIYNYPIDFIEEVRLIDDNDLIPYNWFELTLNQINSINEANKEQKEILFNAYLNTIVSLRIYDLVDSNYKNIKPSKIDFRKHLEQNIQLKNKDVTMSNGRPVEAIYTYNGINIARIRFEFEFDSIGFISRRKEILGYYNTNNEILEEYVISDEEYGNTEYQLGKKFDESVKTRENVFKNIMTTVNMVLINHYVPLGDTIAQAQKRGSDMYTTYNKEINSWIQTGDGDLNQLIGSDTVYSWLELEVSTGVTIRQFITSKID